MVRFCAWLSVVALLLGVCGCGGTLPTTSAGNNSSPFNGIYRTSITRGNTAITVYVSFPDIEMVVTDEGGTFPSYVGSSTTALTNSSGVYSFSTLTLTASDGETAQASGTFGTASTGTGNALTLTVTGGFGFSGEIPATTTATNSLFTGTYSGPWVSRYTLGSITTTGSSGTTTTTEPAGTVTSLTLVPNSNTGGYTMNASGSTLDPNSTPVTFTITNAQVDPCGIISNMSITFTYSNGTLPVTNTYTTAYLNLGVVATTSMIGFFQSATTGWFNGAQESDSLQLTQSGSIPALARTARR